MNKPVSVVMTVYNAQDYLPEAIESILNQTFTDYEFIIVDDCSTDNSLQIAREYEKMDARIQVHHHRQNMGIADARNTGLKLAQGKYIAWMDADDISMSERIEKELVFLESHPQVGVISSSAAIIDSKGNLLHEVHMPQMHFMIAWAFCFFDPIINPAVMLRRDLYSKVGVYRNLAENVGDYFPEDFDLWVRMITKTQFYNLNEPLLKLRKHENNITKTRTQSTLNNSLRICGWYLESLHNPKINASDAELLWNPVIASNSFSLFQVMYHLYRFFIKQEKITDQEKEFIKKDVVIRLRQILNENSSDISKIFFYCLMKKIEIEMRIRKRMKSLHQK